MNIRNINADDADSWLSMWHEYLDFYQTKVDQAVTTNALNKLLSDDKTINCLVACDEKNVPIGFLSYVLHFSTWRLNPVCYLHDLYVKLEYRQAGVAKQLLERLTEIGKSETWARIYWFTKPDNVIARSFYDQIAQVPEWVRYDINL